MKTPIYNVLSMALPVVAGTFGYYLTRAAKSPTNMGEALGPFFAVAMLLTLAAVAGELAAIISLVRGERLGWLSWMGVAVNGLLLAPVAYMLGAADWR